MGDGILQLLGRRLGEGGVHLRRNIDLDVLVGRTACDDQRKRGERGECERNTPSYGSSPHSFTPRYLH